MDIERAYIIDNSKLTTVRAEPLLNGMFVVELSSTGLAPATHWISSGLIPTELDTLLGSIGITAVQENNVYLNGQNAMDSLNLKFVVLNPFVFQDPRLAV